MKKGLEQILSKMHPVEVYLLALITAVIVVLTIFTIGYIIYNI